MTEALKLGGFNQSFVERRIRINEQMHKNAEALADCESILKHVPNAPRALLEQGHIYSVMGRLKEAVAAYTKCLTADSQCVKAYAERAVIYRRMGKPELAIRDENASRDAAAKMENK